MRANELTFGIEIEATIPASETLNVGGYHRGLQVPWLPQGWNSQRDCSIQATGGRQGVEFVSPVLKGSAGLKQVIEVLATLKAHGAQVNPSCGFHVHVGFDKSTPEGREAANRLVKLVGHFEKAIYAATGTHKREQGRYCEGIGRHGSVEAARVAAGNWRYHVLNMTNQRTVEFRAFAGTLNPIKIVGYVRMCLGLVERATESRVNASFQPKSSYATTDRKGGAGQSALCRLFYQLGWTKGRVKMEFGNVTCEGAPALKQIKKELMRLAKKYDQEQTS